MDNQIEILKTISLTKLFGEMKATDAISIQVNKGDIYGFIGLNGAGKTTLIRMLLGMIKPTSGSVMLFGKELKSDFDLWNQIGYMVETPYSYPNLTVIQNLSIYYKLRGLQNPLLVDHIIEKLKLTKYKDIKANVLSLGNQQRLGIAKALMHQPKLLILDEPINGLDPEGIVEVRELLKDLANNGSTIFLSSHILTEISKIANRIGIIHEGKLIKELTTAELKDQLIQKLIIKTADNPKALIYLLEANYKAVINANEEIEISEASAINSPEIITQLLVENQLPPRQVYLFTEDLEKYFLRIIRSEET